MILEKAINNLKLLEVNESSKVTQVVKELSKFPIEITVFDKHELIVDVIQGLSLSTATLVLSINTILIDSKF